MTAIWLTPFLESPLKSGGYDITNYRKVQKVFGTMDNFKILINAVHKKSIYTFRLFKKYLVSFINNCMLLTCRFKIYNGFRA